PEDQVEDLSREEFLAWIESLEGPARSAPNATASSAWSATAVPSAAALSASTAPTVPSAATPSASSALTAPSATAPAAPNPTASGAPDAPTAPRVTGRCGPPGPSPSDDPGSRTPDLLVHTTPPLAARGTTSHTAAVPRHGQSQKPTSMATIRAT